MPTPESEPKDQIQISTQLVEALGELSPNKVAEIPDLLIAILSKDNLASVSISNLLGTSIEPFLKTLIEGSSKYRSEGGSISITTGSKRVSTSPEITELVNRAKVLSGKSPINTGHLVLAELTRKSSVLQGIFDKLGVKGSLLEEITSNQKNPSISEKKSANLIISQPAKGTETEVASSPKKFKERISMEIINDKLLTNLLISIEGQAVTLIVSESQEDAYQQLRLLNQRLKEDTTNSLDFDLIAVPDFDLLETNPDLAISQIIRDHLDEVVYIPNLHRYWQNNSLRAAVNRGDLKIVTSMGEKAMRKAFLDEKVPKVRPVYLEAPTYQEAIDIFLASKQRLEAGISNGGSVIKITDEAIKLAVRFGQRYLNDEQLPQSAISLILAAATLVKMRKSDKLVGATIKLKNDSEINEDDIAAALKQLTGIEANDDKEKFLTLEAELKKKIVGQDEAIRAVSQALIRYAEGIQDPTKPIATFMFLGPTGVGKTELAKAIAEIIFNDKDALVRFDMSEYGEKHTAARLIGAPPGYVGYEDGGQLTERVRQKPYSLVLFDEFEKAHESLQDMLLQITGEGRLTDSFGRVTRFENTLIIITGNVGSQYYRAENEVGTDKVRAAVLEETREKFRPEFLGRLRVVVFNSLRKENAETILRIQINKLKKRVSERLGIDLQFDQTLVNQIVEKGFSTEKGARLLATTLEEMVETPFAIESARGNLKGKKIVTAKFEDNTVVFA